jgi:hypothetical protein
MRDVIAIAALVLGFATWTVLALGLAYAFFFASPKKPGDRAVISNQTFVQACVVLIAAALAAAGALLALLALVIGGGKWAWLALAMCGVYLGLCWVANTLHRIRRRSKQS